MNLFGSRMPKMFIGRPTAAIGRRKCMWGNMMGWGGGAAFAGWHLIWWVLVIVVVVLLVRSLSGGGRLTDENRALRILEERYARGEIDKTEFEARRRDLS
jgi:putative membrane protein